MNKKLISRIKRWCRDLEKDTDGQILMDSVSADTIEEEAYSILQEVLVVLSKYEKEVKK